MHQEQSIPSSSSFRVDGPQSFWLGVGFLLAGLGTALLGPILPTVAHAWHLSDAASGSLFLAKFVGAFLGGVSVSQRLRLSLFSGTLFCFAGFSGFALAPNAWVGGFTLLAGGFGLGQIIASTNVLAGLRYQRHTGSALATLNFFWALGAVATGLLAAWFVPRFGLRGPLLVFAALFLVCGLGGWLSPVHTTEALALPATPEESRNLTRQLLLPFCILLFLYGGLETCLTSWLTTFTQRYSDAQLLGGQSAVVLLWASLTAGRAVSSAALRVVSELTMQTLGLSASALLSVAIAVTHNGALLSVECVLLGLSLAPFFPSTFALLMHHRPTPRVAGFVLAVSGLGAALFPWLMGTVSTGVGSLRVAMLVPALLSVALLVIGRRAPRAAVDRA